MNKSLYKRFHIASLIIIVTLTSLLMAACAGGLSVQGQAQPDGGGISITGGVDPQPDTNSAQSSPDQSNFNLLILISVLLLIVVLLIVRGSSSPRIGS